MPTLYLQSESRHAWYQDASGLWTTIKDRDDVVEYTFDYSAVLNNGDTILTSSWEAQTSDISFAAMTFDDTTTTVTLTKTGMAKNTITTTDGLTHVKRYHFRSPDCPSLYRDYAPWYPW